MWVVKLGGSLNADPRLAQWLELLVQLGGGRVTLVRGGGRFADAVRCAQTHWQLDDLAAHNMAVLAMAQSCWLAQGLSPKLRLAHNETEIRRVLHGGHTALWMPLDQVRDRPGATTHWGYTSDSIALALARQLSVERMVVVKSCTIDPSATLDQLGAAGVVDSSFSRLAADAGFPIDVVHCAELARMRSLLLDEQPALGG
jgi:5-(aminomethyl)-3-furanmethanol phosphate kinase